MLLLNQCCCNIVTSFEVNHLELQDKQGTKVKYRI